jgi:hypothetical protein
MKGKSATLQLENVGGRSSKAWNAWEKNRVHQKERALSQAMQQAIMTIGILVVLLGLLGLADGLRLPPPKEIQSNLAGNLFADVLIMAVTYSRVLYSGPAADILQRWYDSFGLGASGADVLVGVLYVGVAQAIASAWPVASRHVLLFAVLAVLVQWCGDIVFYGIMRTVLKGSAIGDFFGEWGREAGGYALLGDSVLVLVAVLVAALVDRANERGQAYIALLGLFALCIAVHLNAPRALPTGMTRG